MCLYNDTFVARLRIVSRKFSRMHKNIPLNTPKTLKEGLSCLSSISKEIPYSVVSLSTVLQFRAVIGTAGFFSKNPLLTRLSATPSVVWQ